MKTAILYICNAGYLMPALVSAIEARRQSPTEEADVLILDIGKATAEGEAISIAAAVNSVRYLRIEPEILDGMHVQYARLLLDRFLPPEYGDFIYIDSDTQVWGRLDEFVREPVAGQVLAALDPMAFIASVEAGRGVEWADYVTSLGLSSAAYFNSGVFKAERKAWSIIGEEAAKPIITGKKYRFFDQDAINIVARDHIRPISLKWNFPGFLLGSGVEQDVKPRLVHFMGNPRPWHGPFYPWGAFAWRPYASLARAHPALERYWPKFKPAKYAKYVLQQQFKRFMVTPTYRRPKFREMVRRVEAERAI
jgi:lipopolysaccharide biosynthesis glycosyltransferase